MKAQNSEHLLDVEDAQIIRIDDFKNLYVVAENNRLYKYSPELKLLYQFSFNKLGRIAGLDVSNPQKLLLFFSDYQVILYLDSTLSEIDRLNLDELGYWSISCVGQAPDNMVWMYDTQNNTLIKINSKGKKLYGSNEFFSEYFAKETQINILSNNKYTLLYNSESCLVFDAFGYYIKSIEIPNEGIKLKDQHIFILNNNQIQVEAIKPGFEALKSYPLDDESDVIDFDLHKSNKLYFLSSDSVKRISLN